MYLKTICTFIAIVLCIELNAQDQLTLVIGPSDNSENILNKYKYKQKVADKNEAELIVKDLITALHNDGYLLAQIDQKRSTDVQLSYLISIGPPFEWLALKPGNLDPLLIRKVAYREGNFAKRRFNYKELAKLENSILNYAENNGYPFASLSYDSLIIEENEISASLNLDLGPLIKYDSIRVQGDVLKRPFMESYLGIQQGQPFEIDKVEASVQRLNSLPYARLQKAPSISYQNEEATISYELSPRRVNTIDGIIGFLPRSGSNNGLLITGQFDMELFNPFQSGKHIGIHWRSPSEQSQMLNMVYEHPNFLRSPVSVAAEFEFLKQDTTFSKLNFDINVDLLIGANNRLAIFTEFIESNLLSTSQYQNATELPEFADISNTLYGLSFSSMALDDPLLPRLGNAFRFRAGLGNKSVKRNLDLPPELYEGIDFNSVQYQFDLRFEQYLLVRNRWGMKLKADGGWLENKNLFRNDAYRLGGLNSIRGFDENYYFATRFAKATFENRLFFDENSYLMFFADFGYLQAFLQESNEEAFLGFGTGISFETGRGIFNLIYALGTSASVGPVDLRRSKIHFGYTTRF